MTEAPLCHVGTQVDRTLRLTRVRGVPLAGPALGLSDLLGGHLGGADVAVLHPPVAILARRLGGGEVGPHVRFDVVLRDAATDVVHDPEVALRNGLAQATDRRPLRQATTLPFRPLLGL